MIQKSGTVSRKTQWLRAVAYKVFKTLNDLSSNFTKERLPYNHTPVNNIFHSKQQELSNSISFEQ